MRWLGATCSLASPKNSLRFSRTLLKMRTRRSARVITERIVALSRLRSFYRSSPDVTNRDPCNGWGRWAFTRGIEVLSAVCLALSEFPSIPTKSFLGTLQRLQLPNAVVSKNFSQARVIDKPGRCAATESEQN